VSSPSAAVGFQPAVVGRKPLDRERVKAMLDELPDEARVIVVIANGDGNLTRTRAEFGGFSSGFEKLGLFAAVMRDVDDEMRGHG
jgi:hypothetical protein